MRGKLRGAATASPRKISINTPSTISASAMRTATATSRGLRPGRLRQPRAAPARLEERPRCYHNRNENRPRKERQGADSEDSGTWWKPSFRHYGESRFAPFQASTLKDAHLVPRCKISPHGHATQPIAKRSRNEKFFGIMHLTKCSLTCIPWVENTNPSRNGAHCLGFVRSRLARFGFSGNTRPVLAAARKASSIDKG